MVNIFHWKMFKGMTRFDLGLLATGTAKNTSFSTAFPGDKIFRK